MNTPKGGQPFTPGQRKKLPVNPSLEHLQKQAKRRAKQNPALKLAEAQQQLACEYGCRNWAELAHSVETMSRGADQTSYVKYEIEPLPQAARAVDMVTVRRILREGSFTPYDLDKALAHSLWYGEDGTWEERRLLADLLIDHGADPDGQYGSNYGPIVFGTGECLQPQSLQYLIKVGADVTFSRVPTKYGAVCPMDTVLGTYGRGFNTRKHQMIDVLLEHGAWMPPEMTAECLAIHRGDAEGLRRMLQTDPQLAHRQFDEMPYGNILLRGATLLHCAVEFGEIDCLEALLGCGSDLNAPSAILDGLGGQTPIFHAINTPADGNFPTLEYLSKKFGHRIDTSVRATWRNGDRSTQSTALTPLGYAEQASSGPSSKWRKKIDEELAILRELD